MNAKTLLLLVVAFGLGCGGSDPSGPPDSRPPSTPVATNAVEIGDNFFSPQVASVGGQTTVTWTWKGSNEHNVTFEDRQGSSSTKATGTHERAFAGAGTFRYRCTIHSSNFDNGMIGSVLVQ